MAVDGTGAHEPPPRVERPGRALELVTSSTTRTADAARVCDNRADQRVGDLGTARAGATHIPNSVAVGCALGRPCEPSPAVPRAAVGVPRQHEPGPLDPFAPLGSS